MPSDVSKIDSHIVHRLRLIHRAVLLTKTKDTNSKKAQARFKNDYHKHPRFKSRFARDYVFVKRPLLMACVADRMAYKKYFKLLLGHTGPYQVISNTPERTKVNRDGIRNTVSINKLNRMAKEKWSKKEVTSDTRNNTDTDPVKEASTRTKRSLIPLIKF